MHAYLEAVNLNTCGGGPSMGWSFVSAFNGRLSCKNPFKDLIVTVFVRGSEGWIQADKENNESQGFLEFLEHPATRSFRFVSDVQILDFDVRMMMRETIKFSTPSIPI